ncbi:response regulator [Myxococcus sp. NMCA1]|uniref:response regulator n=1 Tax=Myxococcus sp. NMCA1 TaxID=2996785 RepID=UPI0022858370|nr:response regulator [Myxococcus sp. NMCA1]WAM28522.1 response regulator [Myxococcus sp. NMCA1]
MGIMLRPPYDWLRRTDPRGGLLMANRGCVVVIDDSADFRDVLCEVLAAEGYLVHVAGDGQEGFELVSSLRTPCLILLDLAMPTADGFEFLSLLRAAPRLLGLPVLVLTAMHHVPRPDGIVGMMLKPADLDTILAGIAEHCPRPGLAAAH